MQLKCKRPCHNLRLDWPIRKPLLAENWCTSVSNCSYWCPPWRLHSGPVPGETAWAHKLTWRVPGTVPCRSWSVLRFSRRWTCWRRCRPTQQVSCHRLSTGHSWEETHPDFSLFVYEFNDGDGGLIQDLYTVLLSDTTFEKLFLQSAQRKIGPFSCKNQCFQLTHAKLA